MENPLAGRGRPVNRTIATLAVAVLALAGCGTRLPADRVTSVPDDDPAMNVAIAKARSTVDVFIAALKSPGPEQSGFSVKMAFTAGSSTEHMWLSRVSFDGTNFHGALSNEPASVGTVRMGQSVTVSPAEISDWMFIDDGKLAGGETLRVLRNTLPPDERAEFDKSVPFVIE